MPEPYNPWAGQGTDFGIPAGETSKNGNFWDWYNDHGDDVMNIGDWVLCKISPKTCPQVQVISPNNPPPRNNNTAFYLIGGAILLLLILLIFKK